MSVRTKYSSAALAALVVVALVSAFGDFGGTALAQRNVQTPAKRTPASATATKPASAELPKGVKYADGEYSGTAKGFQNNDLNITVKIVDGMIDSITAAYLDTPHYFNRAFKLADDILKKQTADGVHTVTGATFDSKGILGATTSALDQAKKAAASQPASKPAVKV